MTAVRRLPIPVAALVQPPEIEGAACRHADPDLFFPTRREATDAGREQTEAQTAKSICRSCPARTACLVTSITMGEWEGIWGGHTPSERRALVRDGMAMRRDVSQLVHSLERGIRFPLRPNDFLAVIHELTLRRWSAEKLADALGVRVETVVQARVRARLAAAVLTAMEAPDRSERAAA